MRTILLARSCWARRWCPWRLSRSRRRSRRAIAGTRLDVTASGEVTRVPDLAIISAGVVTKAATAGSARSSRRQPGCSAFAAALKAAGVTDRDIQTSNISLNPEYRYVNNQPPATDGLYARRTQVTVRFRDIANAGKILDALVAEGANQINGPTLTIDKPEAALDEARAQGDCRRAVHVPSSTRDRWECASCASLSVSESGASYPPPPPMPMMMRGDGCAGCGYEDRSRRAEAAGQLGDDVRAAVKRKGRAVGPARPLVSVD